MAIQIDSPTGDKCDNVHRTPPIYMYVASIEPIEI